VSAPIRFVIVGCGAISKKHIEAIKATPDAELAGVVDLDAAAAERAGKEAGVPWFTDPDKAAAEIPFEIFDVLTPSGAHAASVLPLVKHGKHFVVEKPMALRLEEADALIRACDENGLKLFVVQQNRFNKPIQALKKALDSGRFGKPVLGTVRVRWRRDQAYYDQKSWRGTWESDGGVLTNQASHHIDMLTWLMGDVESVSAMAATQLVNIEVEDTAVATVRFTSGALGVIEATTAARPKDIEGSISVLCEKASVEIGGFAMDELKVWNVAEPTPEDEKVFEENARNPAGSRSWNHAQNIADIVDAVRTGRRGLIEGIEGRRSLELIFALYESIETGVSVPVRFTPRRARLGLKSKA
jgi:predicted dehydrogenase